MSKKLSTQFFQVAIIGKGDSMSEVRRNRNFGIMIPVCLCAILVIANLMQYFYFYRVLNEVYKICKEVSGENALALMEYTNNLETDSLLSTGLTVISIAVAMWIGLNIYNVVNKQDVENTLESFKEAQKEAFENNNKRIDDSDEKREKKVQYLTRKVEFANLLYLTGERYYASDFFANLFWNTKMEYSNINSIIKYEKKYIYCCRCYENNEKIKANMQACDLIDRYRELISEKPCTTWDETDPMKNFLRMRLSDVLFYKNMTTNAFNMEEAKASVEYYDQVINHSNDIKKWDDEIKAYFYNSQGYTLYHMSKHAPDEEKKKEYLNQALKKMNDAVLKAPLKGRYKRNLGLIYQSMNEYEEARKRYKEAVEKDPLDYKAYNTVAALDLKEIDKAVAIDDRNEILLDELVFADEIKQKWQSVIEEDIRWCKIAEKLSFSFVDTHYNMAKAYLYKYIFEERTNSRLLELAKEQIGIAKGLNPDAPGTKFIQRNIYEADGNFKEAYECVGEDLIKKDDENDKNSKLRKRYDEKMKQCHDK